MNEPAFNLAQESQVRGLVEPVSERARAWSELSDGDRLEILENLLERLDEVADTWVEVCAAIHGGGDQQAEGWASAPAWMAGVVPTASTLHGLIRSYEGLIRDRRVPQPPSTRVRANGQVVATVGPASIKDRFFAPGARSELWLEPGWTGSQGAAKRVAEPGVCLILGAGNYEAPIDILRCMFVGGQVVIYKPNPVNKAQRPILEQLLEPLIAGGYLVIAPADTETAQQLIHHPGVDRVFMTGSAATYDRIVWGDPQNQPRNKIAGRKLMDKPFEAELGGVSPAIVVPGRWTDKEIEHHAAQFAAAKQLNAGHICSSLQVIVLSSHWPQRQQFLERVQHHLRASKSMPTYYPGTERRQASFQDNCGETRILSSDPPDADTQDVVWIPDVRADGYAMREEAFSPVLGVAEVDAKDTHEFLAMATRFCNKELFGSLSATLVVDPRTQKKLGPAVEEAVADLRYGAIGVNTWGGMLFFQGELQWGAYPGHSAEDIQSGVGQLNNTYLLDGVQKAVLWTPFVSPVHVQPASPADGVVYPRIGRYALHPTWRNLVGVLSGIALGR